MFSLNKLVINVLLVLSISIPLFTGCGDEIFDLAEQANEGIVIGAALVNDGVTTSVILTDGEDYYRQINADIMGLPSGGEKLCLDRKGRIHIATSTMIYTYSPEDKQWYISTAFSSVNNVVAGKDEVYALVYSGMNYIYRFDRDSGNQWVDTGINISSFASILSIERDTATGNVFLENYNAGTATMYRLPDLTPFGAVTSLVAAPTNFSVYNNEELVFSNTNLYSSIRGQMTSGGSSTGPIIIADSSNIFYAATMAGSDIYQYNNVDAFVSIYTTDPVPVKIANMGEGMIIVGVNSATADKNGLFFFDYKNKVITKKITTANTYAVTTSR
ncbi:MAG TPA: hypothetical protein PK544_15615 [Spirochaetota bacterium]|nr:hypothetical protein [Spirochaetota bacterium]